LNRRTKYEIWVEILEICLNKPLHQSKILRELRLKTEMVKEALNFLKKRGLIEETEIEKDNWTAYRTTLKGKQALNHFYTLIQKFFTKEEK
jgi:predicted transcriptional regulator